MDRVWVDPCNCVPFNLKQHKPNPSTRITTPIHKILLVLWGFKSVTWLCSEEDCLPLILLYTNRPITATEHKLVCKVVLIWMEFEIQIMQVKINQTSSWLWSCKIWISNSPQIKMADRPVSNCRGVQTVDDPPSDWLSYIVWYGATMRSVGMCPT